MELEGYNIIQRHRALMIHIRKEYGVNWLMNSIHGSDSRESAKREIDLVFNF